MRKSPACRACPAILLLILLAILPSSAAGKPNFVVIMADDLGYGDLGCFGNEEIATPHIDALARSGMRLTDFHSNGNVCSPTRAALLTGRYQQRAGIEEVIHAKSDAPTHRRGLQPVERTFAEALGEAGYRTAVAGKWHLGYAVEFNPLANGFDEFEGYVSGNVDFQSHIDGAGRHDWWDNRENIRKDGYSTHLITARAVDFLRRSKEVPFCLYVAHEAPHYPYQGPRDPPVRAEGKGGADRYPKGTADHKRAYREMVEEMDKGVGEIVRTLRDLGLSENTLVFFFSDNGATPLGSNGKLRGHKGSYWEGGHRVPCIAAWPGTIAPGVESAVAAMTMDIFPTLLDAAGIGFPEARPFDGVSLLGVLTKQQPLPRRTLFWANAKSAAMRDGDWKLVLGEAKETKASLFALAEDPGEENDVAEQYPERIEAMTAALEAWKADVADGATAQAAPGDE